MSNPKIILSEINELHECIEVICHNIGRISMGSHEHDQAQQEALVEQHKARIAELEHKLVNLK